MILLHAKGPNGYRYDRECVLEAINLFLRSRCAYKSLRGILILPSQKYLRSYFGKLGSPGSFNECKEVIDRVFLKLDDNKKICFISADEIYVKPANRFRGNHIVGMAVNQDQPCPAKTVLTLMVNPIFGAPAFVARLLPVNNLTAEFLFEQLQILINIIHESCGVVFAVMTDNLTVNQKTFRLYHDRYFSSDITSIEHPITNSSFSSLFLLYDPVHLMKNIRNNWLTEKMQTLEFKDPNSGAVVKAKWKDIITIYRNEQANIIKTTQLNHQTLYPSNFDKQKVKLVFNVFNDKTVARLQEQQSNDTAAFVKQVTRLIKIINVKSPHTGTRHNDDDRRPITDPKDPRLTFIHQMATCFKEMDNGLRGRRIRGLTSDTANALHRSLNGLIQVTRQFLSLGMPYVLLGKLQSDRLEAEFGIYRQSSGGNYLISVEQVLSSLSLQRLKLFHKLDFETTNIDQVEDCCKENLLNNEDDIELIENCFEESSNLNDSERSTLYYICGYITHKEKLIVTDALIPSDSLPASEFTTLVSRGKLSHPPSDLYDLSLYLYTFFKNRPRKCCSNVFLQAYNEIYMATEYMFSNPDNIFRRLNNCFMKAFAKNETDKIKGELEKKNLKRRKLESR